VSREKKLLITALKFAHQNNINPVGLTFSVDEKRSQFLDEVEVEKVKVRVESISPVTGGQKVDYHIYSPWDNVKADCFDLVLDEEVNGKSS